MMGRQFGFRQPQSRRSEGFALGKSFGKNVDGFQGIVKTAQPQLSLGHLSQREIGHVTLGLGGDIA